MGWSSIEALSSVSKYVQPQVKQSSVSLSPKSLELCTENLGNETGSDIIESSIDQLLSSWSEAEEATLGTREQKRKAREGRSFPPPLTTIRGSESIRVRPHREDGRLLLQVTKVPSCFQAQRSHGRLRLCFWTQYDYDYDYDYEIQEESETNAQTQDLVHEVEKIKHQHSKSWTSVEGVVRVGNQYERPSFSSRCKEGDETNDLLKSWGEPRLVAT